MSCRAAFLFVRRSASVELPVAGHPVGEHGRHCDFLSCWRAAAGEILERRRDRKRHTHLSSFRWHRDSLGFFLFQIASILDCDCLEASRLDLVLVLDHSGKQLTAGLLAQENRAPDTPPQQLDGVICAREVGEAKLESSSE